jgi:hypothetical protein
MTGVGGDQQVIAGAELARLGLRLETTPRHPLDQQNPLGLGLIVPETRGGTVTAGEDSLDAEVAGSAQFVELLLGKIEGELVEEVQAEEITPSSWKEEGSAEKKFSLSFARRLIWFGL